MSKYRRCRPSPKKMKARRLAEDDKRVIASLPSSINSKASAKRGKLAIRIEHGALTYRGRSWIRTDS